MCMLQIQQISINNAPLSRKLLDIVAFRTSFPDAGVNERFKHTFINKILMKEDKEGICVKRRDATHIPLDAVTCL